MSNGTMTNVSVDGCGKMILGVAKGADHVPQITATAVSKSISVKRKPDVRDDYKVKTVRFVKKFTTKMNGGIEIPAKAGT